MKTILIYLIGGIFLLATNCRPNENSSVVPGKTPPKRFLVVLGITQDAGYPQIGCTKECCRAYWTTGPDGQYNEESKYITCLAIVDKETDQYWLIEATPDITWQLEELQTHLSAKDDYLPDGIFITHAHIGHYSGLMQLGKEAMNAKSVPVWVMPRLDSFLRNNGPWSQLVSQENISLRRLHADSAHSINSSFRITPFLVPHRDEYSETVGFIIESDNKKILFIPDIDKWEKWDRDIVAEVGKVDIALLDGTFYENGELPGRDMNEIPHPFVEESIKKFSAIPDSEKSKIIFVHFNHTNPLLKKESPEINKIRSNGFEVAFEGMVIEM